MSKKFGWKPDKKDDRDYKYAARFAVGKIPKKKDLRLYCSVVEDQGDLGSCTAQAAIGALEFIEIKERRVFTDLSRLFNYYCARELENCVFEDSGAEIRDNIKALAKIGVCHEETWPYDPNKFAEKPSEACYQEAANHQILRYYRINNFLEFKHCIAEGYPVIFGFSVYEAFVSDKIAKSGMLMMPKSNEEYLGGHAVLAVGYNDDTMRVTVRNSWGFFWGRKGYFSMPYEYVSNTELSSDFWTIRTME